MRSILLDGVELNWEQDALSEIAKIAISQKTGARGLRSIMEKFMLQIMYDLPDNPEWDNCTITKETVLQTQPPIFKSDNKQHIVSK